MYFQPTTPVVPPTWQENSSDSDADDGSIRLIASAEPAVVFASLAAQSVRHLCDVCSVDIVDGVDVDRHARYRIVQPARPRIVGGLARLQTRAAHRTSNLARVHFTHLRAKDVGGVDGGFSGVVTFVWQRRAVTRAERTTATLLVDHAVQTVQWQRSERARAALHEQLAGTRRPSDPAR